MPSSTSPVYIMRTSFSANPHAREVGFDRLLDEHFAEVFLGHFAPAQRQMRTLYRRFAAIGGATIG